MFLMATAKAQENTSSLELGSPGLLSRRVIEWHHPIGFSWTSISR